MTMFTHKNHSFMDDEDLDFIDDFFEDDLFDCNIKESIDPETLKLLEDF